MALTEFEAQTLNGISERTAVSTTEILDEVKALRGAIGGSGDPVSDEEIAQLGSKIVEQLVQAVVRTVPTAEAIAKALVAELRR